MEIRHPHNPDPRRDLMRCASCGEPSIHRFCDVCSQHPAPAEPKPAEPKG